jgi:AraC family transcriptional regulator
VNAPLSYSPTRFPAPVVRTRAAGELLLSETRYGAGAVLPTHAHEYACVVVALEGAFHERFDASTRDVEPGTVVVRPAGEPHSDRFGAAGGRCLNVEVPPSWLARVADAPRSAAYSGPAFAMVGRRLHAELLDGDDLSALSIESLLLRLFVDGSRERRRSGAPPWLARVRDRLRDDPAARVTLGELAASAGVHAVHLASAFRRFYGATVAGYVRQLRVELACRALAATSAPLAEVALVAGFADQSHLGRVFKRVTGMTPAAYRAAACRVPAP